MDLIGLESGRNPSVLLESAAGVVVIRGGLPADKAVCGGVGLLGLAVGGRGHDDGVGGRVGLGHLVLEGLRGGAEWEHERGGVAVEGGGGGDYEVGLAV